MRSHGDLPSSSQNERFWTDFFVTSWKIFKKDHRMLIEFIPIKPSVAMV